VTVVALVWLVARAAGKRAAPRDPPAPQPRSESRREDPPAPPRWLGPQADQIARLALADDAPLR